MPHYREALYVTKHFKKTIVKQLTYLLTFIISTTFLGCGQTNTTDNKVIDKQISEVQPNESKDTKDEDNLIILPKRGNSNEDYAR